MSTSRASRSSSAAHFPGVNNTTVWSDPAARSQIEFDSFVHLAQTAERGKLRLLLPRRGAAAARAAAAGSTTSTSSAGPTRSPCSPPSPRSPTHLGLAGTLNATFHEPYELARQLATLDHLSGGRAGVERRHVVGRVHRRELPPRRLPRLRRPLRARRRVHPRRPASCGTRGPTTSSSPTRRRGQFVRRGPPGAFDHHGPQFDIRGHFTVPRSPQRHPVILQAGDSDGGRELAAATADAHLQPALRARRRRRRSTPTSRARLARYGRQPRRAEDPPGRHVRARRHARRRRRAGRTSSAASRSARRPRSCCSSRCGTATCRPTTPRVRCPTIDPDVSTTSIIQGRARMHADPLKTAAEWRARADGQEPEHPRADHRVTGRQSFIGTPAQVAEQMDTFVQIGRRRRLHPRAPPHADRPRRLRRPGRAAAAGARRVAHRVHETTLRGHLGPAIGQGSSAAGSERRRGSRTVLSAGGVPAEECWPRSAGRGHTPGPHREVRIPHARISLRDALGSTDDRIPRRILFHRTDAEEADSDDRHHTRTRTSSPVIESAPSPRPHRHARRCRRRCRGSACGRGASSARSIAAIIVVLALGALSEIVLPMTFAAVLAIVFKPLVGVLERRKHQAHAGGGADRARPAPADGRRRRRDGPGRHRTDRSDQ